MKKFMLFICLLSGISFACQKENSDFLDEDVAQKLINDRLFVDYVKTLYSVNEEIKLKSDDELQSKETILKLIAEPAMNRKIEVLEGLIMAMSKKYKNNINQEIVKKALKDEQFKYLIEKRINTENNLQKLRVANLPCTDVYEAEVYAAGAHCLASAISCENVECMVGASAEYFTEVSAAEARWSQCMYEYYGHRE
jgi:hypothetical protein